VCGGVGASDYLDYFRAPMFRDGARVGDLMYAVDATHLWVLDVADPDGVQRQQLQAGFGEPLAVAQHQGKLLIASGSQGLLQMDLSDPFAPVTNAQIALTGPALDVYVDGDQAFVAHGEGGVAVVDLSVDPPVLTKDLAVNGFAAAVAARDGKAYVAACDSFAAIDVATGDVLSETWLSEAYDGEVLVAPAKDVALVGGVAFVAAGRFGAVSVDISEDTDLKVVGNCTLTSDMDFYASGVRAQADTLYIAGGEWGVLPVDVSDPLSACSLITPALPKLPDEDGDCSDDPPWAIVPWTDLWEPPPPGKDPIQTLPFGDVVYAFGDARRIGMRAIDIKDPQSLVNVGRYDEPRLVTGIAAGGGRVVVVGKAGGVFDYDVEQLLLPQGSHDLLLSATALEVLEDARWVVAAGQQLIIEGETTAPIALVEPVGSQGLAVDAGRVAVPVSDGAHVIDVDTHVRTIRKSGDWAELPQAVSFDGQYVATASPEWTNAKRLDNSDSGLSLGEHGVFDIAAISDANMWRQGLPRRILLNTDYGLAEVASLGGQAGLAIHAGTEPFSLALPAGTYADGATDGEHLYLVSADRGSYRSQLITVRLSPSLLILNTQAFTGHASGVAVDGDRLYVADADRGIRVFDVGQSNVPQALGVVELEVSP